MNRVRKSSRPSGGKFRIGSPSHTGPHHPMPNPRMQSSDTTGTLENTGRTMKNSLALFLLVATAAYGQETKFLSLAARIDLPDVNGRIDHLSADLKGHRLFVSALGNHTVEVLEVQS